MHFNHFGTPFGSHFCDLGVTFRVLWVRFCTLGVIFGSLWLYFLWQKTEWGAKGAPRDATPEINSPIWRPGEGHLTYVSVFSLKKRVSGISLFFFVILGQPGRSTVWADMQSVHACAVETHFSIFSLLLKTTPKIVHVGSISATIFFENRNFCFLRNYEWIPAIVVNQNFLIFLIEK